jgi:hypothetical protein
MTIHAAINAFGRAKNAILLALCKLNEIQFDAPWAPRRGGCSGL